MTENAIDWDEDVPTTPAAEYQALIRALQRTEGFGIIFVRCSDKHEERLICQAKADLPQKTIDQLHLTADSDNFYEAVESLPNCKQTNILFVRGLQHSLYAYEQTKRESGWTDAEIYSYSWKGVPKILVNLNQQRDRFRNDFNICFVFLLPLFAIKYLIHRAPDFYDWRSGIFEFPMEKEAIDREFDRVWREGNYNDYCTWTDAQRYRKIAEIQDLLAEPQLPLDWRTDLLFELANLAHASGNYGIALSTWDKLLKLNPEKDEVWSNHGNALADLGRYEEATDSYNKALEVKPDDHQALNNRGIVLVKLRRYEEAIDSYDKALVIKPDKHEAWYNRGIVLVKLRRYEEAIDSYDKALAIKIGSDKDAAWYARACWYVKRLLLYVAKLSR